MTDRPRTMIRVPLDLLHVIGWSYYCNPLDNPGDPRFRPEMRSKFLAAMRELTEDWISPDGKYAEEANRP